MASDSPCITYGGRAVIACSHTRCSTDMDKEIAEVTTAVAQARIAMQKVMDQSANDPRMAMFTRDAAALWHQLVAADFLLLRVRDEWQNFKALTGRGGP